MNTVKKIPPTPSASSWLAKIGHFFGRLVGLLLATSAGAWWQQLQRAIGQGRAWFDRKIVVPGMRQMILWLTSAIEKRGMLTATGRLEAYPDWKEQALADFRSWLISIPEQPDSHLNPGGDSCDLYTLLKEFTALRQEIRLQNREQNRSVKTIRDLIEEQNVIGGQLRSMAEHIGAIEDRIANAHEKRMATPFLHIRDALERGCLASREVMQSATFWRPAPKGTAEVVEGYEMALRRFDRALALLDVQPIQAAGAPFDPKIMKAVEKRFDANIPRGQVLEVRAAGFIRKNEVLRTAEVVVNEA
jgi:hypothetical protein